MSFKPNTADGGNPLIKSGFRIIFHGLTVDYFWRLLAGMNENLVTDAKFAFVVAERQKYVAGGGNDHLKNWSNFVGNIQQNAIPPERTQMIHDNIWLIELSNGLPFLAKLLDWAASYSIAIRILFLAESPIWIKYPPDAKTAAEAKPS